MMDRFLFHACPDHHVRGRPAHLRALHTAHRLLARSPELAEASFITRVVCGDLAAVERALAGQPELAITRDAPDPGLAGVGGEDDLDRDYGPKGWDPLLYLCFTRLELPAVERNAVALASLLLDHGADPAGYFRAGDSRYTPLVGAIGEGEEDRPPHPRRNQLVRLLLDRGADPCDNQVIYNLGFRGKVIWFLEESYRRALALGRKADWDDAEWSMLNMGNYGSGARWHLEMAIRENDRALLEWCLDHGANPDAPPKRDGRFPRGSLYEVALRAGRTGLAELLVQRGAARTEVVLTPVERFTAAALRMDRDAVRSLLAEHPGLLTRSEAMFAAAEQDRPEVIELLSDLGVSPDVEDAEKQRPLHLAACANAVRAAERLLARGAAVDPVESNWGNTPLGGAVYYQHREMIALLGRSSRDIRELVFVGNLARVGELLAAQPELARVVSEGHTPLMWLPPHDEDVALELARLLLAHGADPAPRNAKGQTAADRAERLGMFRVAAALR